MTDRSAAVCDLTELISSVQQVAEVQRNYYAGQSTTGYWRNCCLVCGVHSVLSTMHFQPSVERGLGAYIALNSRQFALAGTSCSMDNLILYGIQLLIIRGRMRTPPSLLQAVHAAHAPQRKFHEQFAVSLAFQLWTTWERQMRLQPFS